MMKNKILYKILGLALLVVGAAACDTASQDVEPVVSPDGYTTATFVNATGSTVSEGDTIVYDITLDKTIDRAITFNFRQTGGTANGDDYTVVPGTVAPYSKTAKLLIIFHEDYDFAATETLIGQIGVFSIADKYLVNAATVFPTLNVTINNYISDELTILLSWEQEVTVLEIVEIELTAEEYGNEYTYTVTDTIEVVVDIADEVDWDIYVIDSEGEVAGSAATGDNPEELKLNLPDGVYTIVTDLWSNGLTDYYSIVDADLTMPITAVFTRQGTDIDFEMVQDPSEVPTVDTPGWFDGLPRVTTSGIICEIEVAGGKYTIIEVDGTESGPYKGTIKFQRPENKK